MAKFHNANPVEMRFDLLHRHKGEGSNRAQSYHLHPGDECELPDYLVPTVERMGLALTPGPSPRSGAAVVAPAPVAEPPPRKLPHGVERIPASISLLVEEGAIDEDVAMDDPDDDVDAAGAKPGEQSAAVAEALKGIEASGGRLKRPRRAAE